MRQSYICEICGKEFSSKEDCEKHERSCTRAGALEKKVKELERKVSELEDEVRLLRLSRPSCPMPVPSPVPSLPSPYPPPGGWPVFCDTKSK